MFDAASPTPREACRVSSVLGLASDPERAFFGDAQVTCERAGGRVRYRLDRLDATRRAARGGLSRGWEVVVVSVRHGGAWRVVEVGHFHKRFGLCAPAIPREARAALGAALHAKLASSPTATRRRERAAARALREHAAWAREIEARARDFTPAGAAADAARARAARGPGLAKTRPRPATELARSA